MKCFKKSLSLLLSLAMLIMAFPAGVLTVSAENTTEFLGGEGTEENPYLISTRNHLDNVRKYLDSHFLMVTDIEFTEADFAEGGDFYNDGQGWEPIGINYEQPFFGSFDGGGHTITGLYCNRSGSEMQCAGLFGYNRGTISGLGMEDGSVSVYAPYPSNIDAGGIAGHNYGTISDCYNTSGVSASGGYLVYVGGIAGQNEDTISNCYNAGSVSHSTASYDSNVGGIVGNNGGTIRDCYSISNVLGPSNAGGIAGENQDTIRNCYNTGDVSNPENLYNDSAGGIVGSNGGEISDCYNIGNVSPSSNAGGIAGENQDTIRNCYNTGNVSNSNNLYNDSAGGIVGSNGDTISNCYYLNTASKGVGDGTDTAVKCTVDQMKQRSTFIGFDFDMTWNFVQGNSYSFPTLQVLPYFGEKENTTEFAGGTGTSYDPYLISTKDHLNNVRRYLGSDFLVVSDIEFVDTDFSEGGDFYNDGQGWEPIGTNVAQPFFGLFNAGGHTITGLYCNRSGSEMQCAGLFGYNRGIIRGLGMEDGSVSALSSVGGIAGRNNGTISGCYNTGSVSSSGKAGGIVGHNYGIISDCYNTGNVSASSSAGGIAGENGGTISDCYNTSSVSASVDGGGIAGCNGENAIISNSYNIGSVSASCVGSIAGSHYTTSVISNCYYPDTLSEGSGSASGTATKCTIEQMKQPSTFIGFDFDTVWEFVEGNPYPFPTLQAVPYVGEKNEENITEFAGGTGTPYDPYQISTKDHLNNVRKYLGAHFLMVTDIEFTEADFAEGGDFYNDGQGWEPIGTSKKQPFFGSFNAGGYTITGLYCSCTQYAGLFGYNEGVICNLSTAGGNVLASSHAGGIVGYNNGGTISNCHNANSVLVSAGGSAYAGGIAGYTDGGAIGNCYNTNSVLVTADGWAYAGGIAGYTAGSAISSCYNTSTVSASAGNNANAYVGGITGHIYSNGAINGCYNTGSVSISADEKAYVGGITGYNGGYSTINDCYNTGSASVLTAFISYVSYAGGITGYNDDYSAINDCDNIGSLSIFSDDGGGIAGFNSGVISNCYNAGNISVSRHGGGIVGYNSGVIGNCYNVGNISASPQGGIVGYNNGAISNCYNAGSVTISSATTNANAGGIVGGGSNGTINNCYYLDTISQGVGSGTDTATKCTAEQMKQQATFIGFDFDTVWEIDSYRDYPYPQLKYNRQEPIQSLELLTSPVNNQVIEGLQPDRTGATVKITYKDGTIITTDATAQMFSELDVNQIGPQKIHLRYGGQMTAETVDIEVIPKSVLSISVTTPPDKTTYVQCQPLAPAGGKLTVYYNNNTSETVDLAEAQLTYPAGQTGEVIVTAEYRGATADFIITVTERQVQSISLVEPAKLTYVESQALDLSGGKLRVTYVSEDNYTEEIPLVSSMISGYDPNLTDIQTLTVEYEGQTTSFVVRVVEKSLVSIEVTKKPDKLTYLEGDDFDLAGMEVTAYYNNGTSEKISDYDISGYTSTPGKKTITITYGGKMATFEVTVDAKSLTEIKVTKKPYKLTYLEGDDFDPAGMEVTAYYNNGTSETVENYQISGYTSTPGTKTITITYGGKTAAFKVTVEAKSLTEIKVTKKPSKLTYLEGDDFDPTGLEVIAYYNNGISEKISDYDISGYDSTPGTKTITVTYGDETATFEVTVTPKSLTEIKVTKQPYKLTYLEGDDFDPTGMEVTATYNNGTSEVVDDYQISGYDPTPGTKTITITYGGKTATFEVTVEAKSLTEIKVTKRPYKLTYLEGDEFDPAGMEVTAYYNNGTSETVEDYQLNGYDSTPGTKIITVTYDDETASFTVTVEAKTLVSIAITKYPGKMTYIEGTQLDTTGMELTLTYNNGTKECITTGWTETYDFSRPGQREVQIEYQRQTTILTVTVVAKSLTGIAVTKQPSKLTYLEGEAFDTAGMVVTASYNNGTSETVTGYQVSGYSSTPGTKTVTVTYQGKTASFTVTVQAKSVSSISMKTNPSKTMYLAGEALNLAGAKITVRYNNNTSEDIAVTSAMVSGYNADKVGSQTITVTYAGKSTSFKVTVQSRVPSSITSGTYTVSGGFISKISAGTTVSQLLNGINEKAYCKVYKGNAEVSGGTLVGTGMEVRLLDGSTVKARVTVVVTGDTNGDGNITITDMLAVKSHLLKKTTLSGAAGKAADTSGDKALSITDFIQIKAHILGKDKVQARAC